METKRTLLKTYFLLMVISIFMGGCEEELSTISPNAEPGYFVECYMRPGELYNLTATKIQPIFEDYILDYSYDFDVFIVDTDTAELSQGLFVEPGTGFIYNFGSPLRLDADLDQVSLFVITPTQDTITARTTIPEQVSIESAVINESQIAVDFFSTTLTNQNYYIVIVNFLREDEMGTLIREFDIKYLEVGDTPEPILQEIIFENEFFLEARDMKLTLMRVTEENYNYQITLEDAKSAGSDNITFPAPLAGNIQNGIGIFTAYTEDVVTF